MHPVHLVGWTRALHIYSCLCTYRCTCTHTDPCMYLCTHITHYTRFLCICIAIAIEEKYIERIQFWLDYGNNEFLVPYRNENLNDIELGRDSVWRKIETIKRFSTQQYGHSFLYTNLYLKFRSFLEFFAKQESLNTSKRDFEEKTEKSIKQKRENFHKVLLFEYQKIAYYVRVNAAENTWTKSLVSVCCFSFWVKTFYAKTKWSAKSRIFKIRKTK